MLVCRYGVGSWCAEVENGVVVDGERRVYWRDCGGEEREIEG